MLMCVFLYAHVHALPAKARRGHDSSGTGVRHRCDLHDVGARNQIQFLCKGSKCSHLPGTSPAWGKTLERIGTNCLTTTVASSGDHRSSEFIHTNSQQFCVSLLHAERTVRCHCTPFTAVFRIFSLSLFLIV